MLHLLEPHRCPACGGPHQARPKPDAFRGLAAEIAPYFASYTPSKFPRALTYVTFNLSNADPAVFSGVVEVGGSGFIWTGAAMVTSVAGKYLITGRLFAANVGGTAMTKFHINTSGGSLTIGQPTSLGFGSAEGAGLNTSGGSLGVWGLYDLPASTTITFSLATNNDLAIDGAIAFLPTPANPQ